MYHASRVDRENKSKCSTCLKTLAPVYLPRLKHGDDYRITYLLYVSVSHHSCLDKHRIGNSTLIAITAPTVGGINRCGTPQILKAQWKHEEIVGSFDKTSVVVNLHVREGGSYTSRAQHISQQRSAFTCSRNALAQLSMARKP